MDLYLASYTIVTVLIGTLLYYLFLSINNYIIQKRDYMKWIMKVQLRQRISTINLSRIMSYWNSLSLIINQSKALKGLKANNFIYLISLLLILSMNIFIY